jgi:hypothetical protein
MEVPLVLFLRRLYTPGRVRNRHSKTTRGFSMNTTTSASYFFFLGGADAEMRRIAEVCAEAGVAMSDAGLGWGAKATAYGSAIAEAAEAGFTPVLVELEVDCELPSGTLVVDHHGERASEPASLLQVLALLGREPSRWDVLVATNDSEWFLGLLAVGATAEEMGRVRAADRFAQGTTPEQEEEAERALSAPAEYAGTARVVRMSHSKCATVTDRLWPSWPDGRENVLILSMDGEANYFGDVTVREALHKRFSGGWIGGDPTGNGFWGGYPDHKEVVAFLQNLLS